MAIDQITTGVIKDDAVTAAKIPAGAVVADIATGGVATAKLADDAVTIDKIAADAVGAAQLASNAVVNASVATGAAIDIGKLAGTASKILETSGTGAVQASSVASSKLAHLDVTQSIQAHVDRINIENNNHLLRFAITENKVAFNAKDSFIDAFEDEGKVTAKTNVNYRPAALGEYFSTAVWTDDGFGTYTVRGVPAADYPAVIDDTDSRFGFSCFNGYSNAGNSDATYIQGSDIQSHPAGVNHASGADFTVEYWFKYQWVSEAGVTQGQTGQAGASDRHFSMSRHASKDSSTTPRFTVGTQDATQINTYGSMNATNQNDAWNQVSVHAYDEDWHHFCFQRYSSNVGQLYIDGQRQRMSTDQGGDIADNNRYGGEAMGGTGGGSNPFYLHIGNTTHNAVEAFRGKIDEFRLSKVNRYGQRVDFDPPTKPFVGDSDTIALFHFDDPATDGGTIKDWSRAATISSYNATGSFTNSTNTVTGSRDRVSITVLYKNIKGTATLNTDLKAEVSGNGGSAWAMTTLVSHGTMSVARQYRTGKENILMASASNVAVTGGTDIRYRISFANQSGTKYTEVHGVALTY